MSTYYGTAGNDAWTVVNPGTFTLDGLGGVDTLYLGTSLRSAYAITLASDGSVHVDSVSSASAPLHATLLDMEILVFDSGRDSLDLRTYFAPPTVSFASSTSGTATGNVSFALTFSVPVSGLTASDFTVSHGSVVSVGGTGSSYAVVVAPAAGFEGSMSLTLKAGGVADAAGVTNAAATSAAQAVDTLAPTLVSFSPAANGIVDVSSALVITFSEPVQRGSGALLLEDGSGATVASYDVATSTSINVAGDTLTLHPTGALKPAGTYTLSFAAGAVRDLAGNAVSSGGSDTFGTATDAVQLITGTPGNDVIPVSAGHESIDGLGGIDTVVLAAPRAAYQLAPAAGGFELTAADSSGTYDLANIERLQFADVKLALDIDGHAGAVAKTLGAVFGAASVSNAVYAGIGLQLMDGGMSDETLMQLALNVVLGANPTNRAVVDLLYTNVVGVAPTPDAEAAFVSLLDSGAFTQAGLGVLAADHPLNTAHIDLAGLAQTGLVYVGG